MSKAFLAAALALAIAAALTTPVSAADAVMKRLSSAKLSAILTAAGGKEVEVTKPKDGIEVVTFNDGQGPVDFVLSDCTSDGCQAMQMSILFDRDESKKIPLATVNSYNAKILNAQAALLPEGNLLLADLFVTIGGVTEDSLKENISIFLQAPQLLAEHIRSQTTVSNSVPATVMPASATPTAGIQVSIATQGPRLRNLDVLELLTARPNRVLRHLN